MARRAWVSTWKRHGAYGTPEHTVWRSMLQRCIDSNSPNYPRYGGRGISVCASWRAFPQFLADVGMRPSPEYQLDRWPNRNGNYEPGNVRWATRSQNQRNRDCNRTLTVNGQTLTIAGWAEATGLSYQMIHQRVMKYGYSAERAISQPARIKHNQ